MSEQEEKEIEVVTGDGTNLTLSPVYEHLKAIKPKPKEEDKKKDIIIPGQKTFKIEKNAKKEDK